ncbi:MAG: methionyl-tRNA formyltransferase [Candidatus Zixiibacteriota bacterium]
MKIVYMGTPEFARKPLLCLHESKHEIVAVVTGPDERSGRGGRFVPTPVRKEAERLGLTVFTPLSLKDDRLYKSLQILRPDLIVVIAFKILPEKLFTLPRFGSINIHASLLPKYRGAAPIHWALINGEKETGLTSFFLKKKVDTGDIILQEKITINHDENYDQLSARLSEMAGPFLLKTIDLIEKGEILARPQQDEEATPAPKITPETAMIDFGFPAERVRNFVRGLSSHPCAYTFFRGKKVKILACREHQDKESTQGTSVQPGTILENKKMLLVQCADSIIEVLTVLPEGKRQMDGVSFLNGFKPKPGESFGI